MIYANLWQRCLAYTVDFLILVGIFSTLLLIFFSSFAQHIIFDMPYFDLENFGIFYIIVSYIKVFFQYFLSPLIIKNNFLFFIVFYFSSFVCYGLYFIIQQSSSSYQTIGMKLLKIHLVSQEGSNIKYLQATYRFLLLHIWFVILDFTTILLYALLEMNFFSDFIFLTPVLWAFAIISTFILITNLLVISFSTKKQGLHDWLTNTYVIVMVPES